MRYAFWLNVFTSWNCWKTWVVSPYILYMYKYIICNRMWMRCNFSHSHFGNEFFSHCSIRFDNHAETDGILSPFQNRGIVCRALASIMRSRVSWRWGKTRASVSLHVPDWWCCRQTNISTKIWSRYRFVTKMIAFDNNAIADVLEFMLAFYYCSVSAFGSKT